MEDILNQLNDSQRDAVLYIDGAELVIAGAGSGKTRVLTYKIAYLLSIGMSPYNILALTFTNKAAREMKERIAQLTDPDKTRRLWMGTFHSIFSRILRRESELTGYSSDFSIYDSDDSKNLIKTIIREMGLDDKQYRPGLVQNRISQAKNALVTYESYSQNKELVEHDMNTKVPMIRDIYARYQNRCFQAGAMDFDDLLLQTNILFRDHPETVNKYGNQFKYILVDEYQDTNFAQYLIVQRLAQIHGRLCVVGDDAQSIYSFRGANIDNILKFRNQYPDCRIFKLERNYRSTQNIVNLANSLIAKNNDQIHKNVYSEKEKGNKIKLIASYSDHEEAYLIGAKIMELRMIKAGKYLYSDFAVLYRTNAQSRVIEEAFRKRNIPYRVFGGFSFYQRKEIKDVIAYLRIIVNPNDEEALKRIINYPTRGIGDTTVAKLAASANANNTSLWEIIRNPAEYGVQLNSASNSKLAAFRKMIEHIMQMSAELTIDEIAALIIHETGIANEFKQDNSVENISRMENIQELSKGMKDFVIARLEEGATQVTLSDYLSEIALYTDHDNETEDNDKVTMMTVHSAKGLEFKNVIVSGLEEDLFPSSLSKDNPKSVEEERRLFYVAITRAEENCILTYTKNRFRNGTSNRCSPSRFLLDLDLSLLEMSGEDFSENSYSRSLTPISGESFRKPATARANPIERDSNYRLVSSAELSVGMKVMHERFGFGEILSVEGTENGESAIIEFENLGSKRLILKFAYLKIL